MGYVKGITYGLGAMSVVLAGAIMAACWTPDPVRDIASGGPERNMSAPQSVESSGSDQPSFDIYEHVFSERDVFQAFRGFSASGGEKTSRDESQIAGELLEQRVKVLAILIDQNPRTVIRDLVSQEVVYLSVGDRFSGAVVTEILPGKVVFNMNGQAVTLSP